MFIFKKIVLMFFTAVILLAGIFMAVQPASAALLDPLVPACRAEKGGCDVCDAIEVGINITKIMLGTLGSAALLIFVYGGVLMATSRGHTDQVQKGKDALTNAVKGVIIVLASWVVVNYGLAIMLGQDASKTAIIFGGQWAKVACNSQGESCGAGWAYNSKKECVTKCESTHPTGYACQDTSPGAPANGKAGCEINLCPGPASIQCCPVP